MNSDRFRVLQIDHVELFVPDREAAAAWYENVLGLISVPEAEHWAKDPESRSVERWSGPGVTHPVTT